MLRLAFDCSGDVRSCAVTDGEAVVVARSETGARQHAEALVPLLHDTVAAAGLRWSSLDEVVVAVGPGSFTGVRIAVAAARALALALERPARSVTTLDALLAAAPEPADLAAIDARRGGVYVAVAGAGGMAAKLQPTPLTPLAATALVASPMTVIGSGATLVVDAAGSGRAIDAAVDARAVARCAFTAAARGVLPLAGTEVRPLYLRAPDAVPQAA